MVPALLGFVNKTVRRSRALSETPQAFPYSSFGGYARKSQRLNWVAYGEHHRYWSGLNGGIDPTSAYRWFVIDGMIDSVDPKIVRLRDWIYGGEDFLKRVLSMAEGDDPVLHRPRVRRANPVSVDSISEATASQYAVNADEYLGFRSRAAGRDMAACLCRRFLARCYDLNLRCPVAKSLLQMRDHRFQFLDGSTA